ncbi:hypothetical protein C8R43DRAFT_1124770 [Mycena crocata]|nr:hypothetical protein C8R43DRAFT_1124770 [Mycena crocata]
MKVLSDLNTAVWASGVPHPDRFLATGMLLAMSTNHHGLAQRLLGDPNLSVEMIKSHLAAHRDFPPDTSSTALAATSSAPPPSKRENCTTKGCLTPMTHSWPYCTSKGGGMDGKSIKEATEARRADRERERATRKQTSSGGGSEYWVDPKGADAAPAPPPVVQPSANFVNLKTDDLPTEAAPEVWEAIDEPTVSLNWCDWTVNTVFIWSEDTFALYADTGANVHISPVRSDFMTFTPITPRPIKGFQGSSIMATGIGTIVTDWFTLENVNPPFIGPPTLSHQHLYIPFRQNLRMDYRRFSCYHMHWLPARLSPSLPPPL